MNFPATGSAAGSARTPGFDEQLHFGSKKFLSELRDSESVWSLMVDGAGRGGGVNSTRICPVFVLSLKNLADPYLVDGRAAAASHGDGTVIITGVSSIRPASVAFVITTAAATAAAAAAASSSSSTTTTTTTTTTTIYPPIINTITPGTQLPFFTTEEASISTNTNHMSHTVCTPPLILSSFFCFE